MPGMPERHSKDCKVSVGSKTTAHRREIRLDFSATDARVQCRFGSLADICSATRYVRFVPGVDIGPAIRSLHQPDFVSTAAR